MAANIMSGSCLISLSGPIQLDEPDRLLAYGGSIDRDGVRYRPSVQQLETIWALHSMGPQTAPGGAWVFDVSPPVLAYLRQRDDVLEGPGSRQLEIGGAPARTAVAVDFKSGHGATVVAGYDFGDGLIVQAQDVERTPDGGYVRIANRFVPIQDAPSAFQPWLERGTTTITPDNVPAFFLQDLASLRGLARIDLSPAAAEVEIGDGGAPRFTIDARVPGWLDFSVEYGSESYSVPIATAAEAIAGGHEFVEVAPGKFVRVDADAVADATRSLAELKLVATDGGGYQVPAEQIGQLQDVVANLGGVEEVSAAYRSFLEGLTGLSLDPTAPLPPAIEAMLSEIAFTLRPYQRQGIAWLRWLADHGLHGLLADDMGLGKTVQAALAVRAAMKDDRATRRFRWWSARARWSRTGRESSASSFRISRSTSTLATTVNSRTLAGRRRDSSSPPTARWRAMPSGCKRSSSAT